MDAQGWDERYSSGQVWSTDPNRFLVDAIRAHGLDRPSPGAAAVDLGCGEGRNAVWLASLGWTVTGVDFSTVGVERGRQMAAGAGVAVDWRVADLRSWDFGDAAWDLAVVVYVHWPSRERHGFRAHIAAALKPGGHVVLVDHDRRNLEEGFGGPRDPDVLATVGEEAAALRNLGLVVVDAHEVRRAPESEPGHGHGPEPDKMAHAIDHVVVARR